MIRVDMEGAIDVLVKLCIYNKQIVDGAARLVFEGLTLEQSSEVVRKEYFAGLQFQYNDAEPIHHIPLGSIDIKRGDDLVLEYMKQVAPRVSKEPDHEKLSAIYRGSK